MKPRAVPDSAVIRLQAAKPIEIRFLRVHMSAQTADRNAEDGVEDGERGAVEEAELSVVDPQVGADVLREDGENLTVDEVEDVDQDEDAQDVVGVPPAGRLGVGVLRVLVC